jgi:ABC-type uncharacterized transport system substrate-binding protein
MNLKKIEILLVSLFLILSLAVWGWSGVSKPRILILHSYDDTYSWVRDINIGLKRVLNQEFNYKIRWYYMDTKRNPDQEYKTSAGIAARRTIEKMHPDVVIAFDDDAQAFATRHFIDHPKIKIIFSGVNNQAEDYGFDQASNVTGVLERLPLAALRETFLSATNLQFKDRPIRIAMLGDTSETVKGDAKQVGAFNWNPIKLSEISLVDTWPEWQAAVAKLGEQVDVILLTNYRKIARSSTDLSLVSAYELVSWTEAHSKVPVVSANGFFAEEGGMLAIGTSPYEQGTAAAEMALKMIQKGFDFKQTPIIESTQFIVTMSASKMQAREFVLPMVYEAAARADNKFYP